MSDDERPKLAANFKKKQNAERPETPLIKFSKAMDEYKALLSDKIHPNARTASYEINVKSIINRLLVAADELDNERPGDGIFGLIIATLSTSLSLKDKNLELEVKIRDLDNRIKRLEKQK